eukprot:XP_001706030.1 Hypothetical protein GL50803_39207 [Giardia lamblia ATCC 50803]
MASDISDIDDKGVMSFQDILDGANVWLDIICSGERSEK